MLTIKNLTGKFSVCALALAFVLGGCTPAGPRALQQGARLLEAGDYPAAVEKFRLAASLMSTNAQAWNYLGVACHRAGDAAGAAQNYQQALKLNRDLVETHFNLGCLWLEQNRLDNAKSELAAFTLRRGNSAAGWLKLGSAQLRSHDLTGAEKSYAEALRCSPQNPEALNGLGLIQQQRSRPHDAAQSFEAALQQQPDYAPALLNLAIVSQYSLNNRARALQRYREYLALPVHPANWEAVNATAAALDQDINAASHATLTTTALPPVSNPPPPRPTSNVVVRANMPVKPEPTSNIVRPAVTVASASGVVKVPSQPEAQMARDVSPEASRADAAEIAGDEPSKTGKPGFFQKVNPLNLFRHAPKETPKVTSLQPAPDGSPKAAANPPPPAAPIVTGPASIGRYNYHSPSKPASGNRLAAEKFFMQGLQSQRAGELPAALQSYRQATATDPAYFEAYYNLGIAAAAAGDLPQALSAGEFALAIRPESTDARLNFAQLLKQVNYFFDAANELATVLAKNPDEPRAHLALGNLYARQFNQPAQARAHYLKVLELDPRNSQAAAIRDWLVAHPR